MQYVSIHGIRVAKGLKISSRFPDIYHGKLSSWMWKFVNILYLIITCFNNLLYFICLFSTNLVANWLWPTVQSPTTKFWGFVIQSGQSAMRKETTLQPWFQHQTGLLWCSKRSSWDLTNYPPGMPAQLAPPSGIRLYVLSLVGSCTLTRFIRPLRTPITGNLKEA